MNNSLKSILGVVLVAVALIILSQILLPLLQMLATLAMLAVLGLLIWVGFTRLKKWWTSLSKVP
jgi:hypothetical protein